MGNTFPVSSLSSPGLWERWELWESRRDFQGGGLGGQLPRFPQATPTPSRRFEGLIPLIVPAEHERSEADGPQAVVDLLEADPLTPERFAEVEAVALEADAALAPDPPHLKVAGVADLRLVHRISPRRLRVELGRWHLADRLVRPLVVVLVAEAVEGRLLGLEARRRRSRRLCLQRAVHPLVAAILLRMAGLDEDRLDAELDPPDRQPRQPSRRRRTGERRAAIGQDRPRQPVGRKGLLEDRPGVRPRRRAAASALEQEAAAVLGPGQREAQASVAGAELPLEIRRPQIVGLRR